MDITLTWAIPVNQLPADEYDVLYKVWDPIGLNNWILANPSPLPNTTTTYTITGLNPNTIYRVAVTKSCLGTASYVDEATYVNVVCPIISFWQGPKVNSEQTLFYSVNYPDATHVTNTEILVYDTTFDDRFLSDCGSGATSIPIGRTSYQIVDGCTSPNIVNCVRQIVNYNVPNTGVSAVGYYGLDTIIGFNPFVCDGASTDPILFREGNTYKFELTTIIDEVALGVTIDFSTFDTTCTLAPSAPVYTFTSHPIADVSLLSSALCVDNATGLVSFTIGDGTDTTDIIDYTFSYTTSDGAPPNLPLLDNTGNPITTNNGTYNIYAPVKIETFAPGGGNVLGYTITNAVVSGPNTTYTYIGGTNAFTVGQEVFVNSVNPSNFDFVLAGVYAPKTIIAATANSFTVSYAPAGTYQTGGIASAFLELTDGMTITVDLQPLQNVITLTNQNYSGLTLKQALDNIANSINTTTTYSASAVIIGGIPYLKINVPGTTYTSASITFEGPNILTKGAPDILQISEGGALNSSRSSVKYNGFLYTSFVDIGFSYAKIVASSYTNIPAAATYSHTINTGIGELVLVPEAPPTTVYSLDHVTTGGNYSLNIATDETTGYSYVADNLTVSIYDGKNLIDSQDLSVLPGGPLSPIRLMEFNSTDNTLYVFVDGTVNNFYIVDVGPWGIVTSGTYSQTNYVRGGTITAWNNLTTGSTAAMGTMTSVTAPSPVPNPPNFTPLNSVTFQDTTKTGWNIVPPAAQSYSNQFYTVYNYDQNSLGELFYYGAPQPPYSYPGITGGLTAGTVNISRGVNTSGAYVPFLAAVNDNYGIFHRTSISDYNAFPLFNDRFWANTSRYVIRSGRNGGSNGFLDTTISSIKDTTFGIESYVKYTKPKDKMTNGNIGLDDTSEYLLFDITDGGTCYNSTSNFVYISLDGGLYEAIDNLGNVLPYQLYKDFTNPSPSNPVQVPLQMVADPNSDLVYGIARDARSDVDDMNIYVFTEHGQVDVIDGSALWNVPICGQISIDSATGILYFTGKHTRNFYEYDPATGFWDNKIVPSLYEKMDGFTYGTGSLLSRLQGVIERVQGATYIGGGKFVVMNYMQQTFSTDLKYVYESSNLFVYDYVNNTIEQALIGTGVNTYSGIPGSYNPNFYGEFFGTIDYNTDYCYGGLGIKVDSNGRIFWKKAVSDQIYMSESHTESGVAQIWGSSSAYVIRIWNIQSNGTLQQSKRTIYDMYSNVQSQLTYDSFHQRVLSIPSADGRQFNIYNPQNLAGAHSSPNIIGIAGKTTNQLYINGITPTFSDVGKPTYLYSISATATEITYNVTPFYTPVGVFPHHYAVGDIITVSGAGVIPALPAWLQATNATITSVTATSFTIANSTGNPYPLTSHVASSVNTRLSQYWLGQGDVVIKPDNLGNVFIIAQNAGGTYPVYTSMFVKYKTSDLFTQRESPNITVKSAISSPCSATVNGIFVKPSVTPLLNFNVVGPTNQGTLWMLGSRNPICYVNGITNATYDPVTQRIRYYINNSFLVGKVVNITGITPSAYNLNRVPIVAADPAWIEISYTGANPGPVTLPFGYTEVRLSTNWVIEVVDFNSPTFNTVATIDMTFANSYLDLFASYGSFQYSAAENKIYLYYQDSRTPVFVFDTISNTLVRTSSFNRMTTGYNKLSYVYSLEDVNGIAYFSAATNPDTPTRRWFRLTASSRNFLNNVHNELNVSTTDSASATTVDTYDLYSLTNMSDTFGQWKVTTNTTWASIPGGSNIVVNPNDIIEFVMFSTDNVLISVKNITTNVSYDIPSYTNLATYPTYNTLNSIIAFAIKADSVNLTNGDILEFTFNNPLNPSCLFINSVTINF